MLEFLESPSITRDVDLCEVKVWPLINVEFALLNIHLVFFAIPESEETCEKVKSKWRVC
jgi:hypothetical protein